MWREGLATDKRIRPDTSFCVQKMISGASRPSTITGDDHVRVISAVWVISEGGGLIVSDSVEEPIQEVDLSPRQRPTIMRSRNGKRQGANKEIARIMELLEKDPKNDLNESFNVSDSDIAMFNDSFMINATRMGNKDGVNPSGSFSSSNRSLGQSLGSSNQSLFSSSMIGFNDSFQINQNRLGKNTKVGCAELNGGERVGGNSNATKSSKKKSKSQDMASRKSANASGKKGSKSTTRAPKIPRSSRRT